MAGRNIPTGVKILSVLGYIGGIFGIVFGILIIVGSEAFLTQMESLAEYTEYVTLAGAVAIALGIFGFFVARGLWKGQNWARLEIGRAHV